MKFPWRCLLVVAAVMTGCVVLAACGGGEEELDLEQYFRRFQDINDTANTRVDVLVEESEGVGEDMEATRDYFDAFNAIAKETTDELKDIHPPAEAQDAHDEYVAALGEALALWEDFGDRLADVESPSGLAALAAELNEPPFATAGERITDACLQLKGIADENGIEVDLGCE